MSQANGKRGAIRVRSNVVFERDRLDLVPGEVLARTRGMRGANAQQRFENMYYALCSLCDRTIMAINLDGCEQCQHAPHPDTVAAARRQHDEIVAKARQVEVMENAELDERRARRRAGRE